MGRIKTTAELEIIAGTTLDIDSSGALQINSSAAAISIGNDAVSQNLDMGTGAASRTITIGNTTGATSGVIDIGTGDFAMASASGTLISQLDTGEMIRSLQPAFLARSSTAQNSVTGAGTTYTIGTAALTIVFDQGSDVTTAGVFTAPVTGRYMIIFELWMNGLTAAMTTSTMSIVTSNRTYEESINAGALRDPNNFCMQSVIVLSDMDAADTATFTILVENGASNAAGIRGNATDGFTYICGFLMA